MVKVRINDTLIEATVTPVLLMVQGNKTQTVFTFYVNGKNYRGYISHRGNLVVNKPVEEKDAVKEGIVEKNNQ